MLSIRHLAPVFLLAALAGCAHPIVITPDLRAIDRNKIVPIEKAAGYYISEADRAKKVESPGGGGDKVAYYPYKELEPAFQKVLYNVFKDIKRLDAPPDAASLKANNLFVAFTPTFVTNSSSSGVFTWMPTNFTVKIDCKAIDGEGKEIWQKHIEESATVTSNEVYADFSIAAKKASEKAFLVLQDALNTAPELRR